MCLESEDTLDMRCINREWRDVPQEDKDLTRAILADLMALNECVDDSPREFFCEFYGGFFKLYALGYSTPIYLESLNTLKSRHSRVQRICYDNAVEGVQVVDNDGNRLEGGLCVQVQTIENFKEKMTESCSMEVASGKESTEGGGVFFGFLRGSKKRKVSPQNG